MTDTIGFLTEKDLGIIVIHTQKCQSWSSFYYWVSENGLILAETLPLIRYYFLTFPNPFWPEFQFPRSYHSCHSLGSLRSWLSDKYSTERGLFRRWRINQSKGKEGGQGSHVVALPARDTEGWHCRLTSLGETCHSHAPEEQEDTDV